MRRGARGVAAHQVEQDRLQCCECERAGVRDFPDPPLHALNEQNRAIDLPERPQRKREIAHRADAGIELETKGEVIVSAGLKHCERSFEMIPRLAISSREPASDSCDAVADDHLLRVRSRRDGVEEGPGVSPHRRELAAHVAAEPGTVGAANCSAASLSTDANSCALAKASVVSGSA